MLIGWNKLKSQSKRWMEAMQKNILINYRILNQPKFLSRYIDF